MGFRFRRTAKILPGVKLNITKNGVSSVSIGVRGAKVTVGKTGVRKTVGLPGTGLSYSKFTPTSKQSSSDIPYTPICPYCGHKMRKAWTNCPKCKNYLLPDSTEQDSQSLHTSIEAKKNNSPYTVGTSTPDLNNKKAEANPYLGCLILIILFFILIKIFL